MILKWMVCDVPSEQRNAFSEAQKTWSVLKEVPGFLGQCGGWDNKTSEDSACILGFWETEEQYQSFMETVHDDVTAASQQEQTYKSLLTTRWKSLFAMPGEAESLRQTLEQGSCIRVADCRLHEGRSSHFVEAQRSVWAPGMAACSGMKGGLFVRHEEIQGRFMVLTFWEDLAAHQHYMEYAFARLFRDSEAEKDLRSVHGYRLSQVEGWRVLS